MVALRAYRPLNVPVAVALDDAAISRADRVLGCFRAPQAACRTGARFGVTRGTGDEHLVLRDNEVVARGRSWDAAVDALVTVVNGEAIASYEGFAIHAGVVAAEGAAIAFPGVSGAGKSTLTAACLLAGGHYVSDEALCVDFDSGLAVPYPKPIRLSAPSQRLLGLSQCRDTEVLLTADELGAATVDAPLPLRHIVELVRSQGAPQLVPEHRSVGLAALLRLSFNHYKRPRAAFELASRLAAGSCAWRLEYSSPRAAADVLLTRLGELAG